MGVVMTSAATGGSSLDERRAALAARFAVWEPVTLDRFFCRRGSSATVTGRS